LVATPSGRENVPTAFSIKTSVNSPLKGPK
jgi:hypothetical protein